MRHRIASMALTAVLLVPVALHAQRGGGGPPGGGGGFGQGMGTSGMGQGDIPNNGAGRPPGPPPPNAPGSQGTTSILGGGLQLGPPGRWWDDRSFAKSLGLKQDQKARMDAIFDNNRNGLVQL